MNVQLTGTRPKPKGRRWRWLVAAVLLLLASGIYGWLDRPHYGAENDARMTVDFRGLPKQFGWLIGVEMLDGTFSTPIQRGPGIVYWDFFGLPHKADDCAYPIIRTSEETLFTGVVEAQYPSTAKRLILGWRTWTKQRGESPVYGSWNFVEIDPTKADSVLVLEIPGGALSKPQEEVLLKAAAVAEEAVHKERNLRRHGKP